MNLLLCVIALAITGNYCEQCRWHNARTVVRTLEAITVVPDVPMNVLSSAAKLTLQFFHEKSSKCLDEEANTVLSHIDDFIKTSQTEKQRQCEHEDRMNEYFEEVRHLVEMSTGNITIFIKKLNETPTDQNVLDHLHVELTKLESLVSVLSGKKQMSRANKLPKLPAKKYRKNRDPFQFIKDTVSEDLHNESSHDISSEESFSYESQSNESESLENMVLSSSSKQSNQSYGLDIKKSDKRNVEEQKHMQTLEDSYTAVNDGIEALSESNDEHLKKTGEQMKLSLELIKNEVGKNKLEVKKIQRDKRNVDKPLKEIKKIKEQQTRSDDPIVNALEDKHMATMEDSYKVVNDGIQTLSESNDETLKKTGEQMKLSLNVINKEVEKKKFELKKVQAALTKMTLDITHLKATRLNQMEHLKGSLNDIQKTENETFASLTKSLGTTEDNVNMGVDRALHHFQQIMYHASTQILEQTDENSLVVLSNMDQNQQKVEAELTETDKAVLEMKQTTTRGLSIIMSQLNQLQTAKRNSELMERLGVISEAAHFLIKFMLVREQKSSIPDFVDRARTKFLESCDVLQEVKEIMNTRKINMEDKNMQVYRQLRLELLKASKIGFVVAAVCHDQRNNMDNPETELSKQFNDDILARGETYAQYMYGRWWRTSRKAQELMAAFASNSDGDIGKKFAESREGKLIDFEYYDEVFEKVHSVSLKYANAESLTQDVLLDNKLITDQSNTLKTNRFFCCKIEQQYCVESEFSDPKFCPDISVVYLAGKENRKPRLINFWNPNAAQNYRMKPLRMMSVLQEKNELDECVGYASADLTTNQEKNRKFQYLAQLVSDQNNVSESSLQMEVLLPSNLMCWWNTNQFDSQNTTCSLSQCKMDDNHEISAPSANRMGSAFTVDAQSMCCKKCFARANCVAVDFNKNTKACTLFSGQGITQMPVDSKLMKTSAILRDYGCNNPEIKPDQLIENIAPKPGDRYNTHDTVRVSCRGNGRLIGVDGALNLTCRSNSTWDLEIPKCQFGCRKFPLTPDQEKSVRVNYVDVSEENIEADFFPYKSNATVQCQSGFTLNKLNQKELKATCDSNNGLWKLDEPENENAWTCLPGCPAIALDSTKYHKIRINYTEQPNQGVYSRNTKAHVHCLKGMFKNSNAINPISLSCGANGVFGSGKNEIFDNCRNACTAKQDNSFTLSVQDSKGMSNDTFMDKTILVVTCKSPSGRLDIAANGARITTIICLETFWQKNNTVHNLEQIKKPLHCVG